MTFDGCTHRMITATACRDIHTHIDTSTNIDMKTITHWHLYTIGALNETDD